MNIINMKYQCLISNAATLQLMIDDLQQEMTNTKNLRTSTKLRIASTIANLMTTQSKLLASALTKLEMDILNRIHREGGVRQMVILSQGDFDQTWDAIANLKQMGLITTQGKDSREKLLLPVIDVENHATEDVQ